MTSAADSSRPRMRAASAVAVSPHSSSLTTRDGTRSHSRAGAGQGIDVPISRKEPTMQTKIAVTGATGRVGSHLVEILEQRGHDVVQIARSKGVDVVTGEGLADALAGSRSSSTRPPGPRPTRSRRPRSSPPRRGTCSAPAPPRARSGSSSSRSSASTSSTAATTRRRPRRSRRSSRARSRSGSFAPPSSTSSSSRWSGGRSRTVSPTCPRCERSSWLPAPPPKPSLTRPRKPRSRTARSPRSPARRRRASLPRPRRCSPSAASRSRSARPVAACWRSPVTPMPTPMRRAPRCPTRAPSLPAQFTATARTAHGGIDREAAHDPVALEAERLISVPWPILSTQAPWRSVTSAGLGTSRTRRRRGPAGANLAALAVEPMTVPSTVTPRRSGPPDASA